MGILRLIVRSLVLPMLNRQTRFFTGSIIGSKFIGDHHPRGHSTLLQQLARQALGGFAIPAALDQDIKDKAVTSIPRVHNSVCISANVMPDLASTSDRSRS